MLNITYSLKLESLVSAFEKSIFDGKKWNDPFNPPLLIFSDTKIEQWFKLHTITKKSDSILMNINTDKLEGFLFKTLAGGIPVQNDKKIWYEKLDGQVLQTLILNKLISKTDKGMPYYRELENIDGKDISSYIENASDGTINQNNLYSFSKNLAQVFTEYIDSRNDDFENGIHSKWITDANCFDFSKEKKKAQFEKIEAWQRKLYKDLLGYNPLTIKSETDGYDIQYVTLAQLVEINKKANNGKLKFSRLSRNIYLFGFNSLGQIYRSLLCEIAKHTEMYLFLQATDVVNQTENQNLLLQKWNKVGNSNFDLWKSNGEVNITSVCDVSKDETSLLKEIQNQIETNTYDESKIKQLVDSHEKSNDESIRITGAPSELKEIEALHSSICQIINKCNAEKLPVSYDDFIVLSPEIQEYKVAVMQVFAQMENNSDVKFPYIPYVFSDFSGEHSAVQEALDIQISILKKDSLNRSDLFSLLRNPVVKKARSFTEEELSAWSVWVENLHGFRNSKNRPDEWKALRNRLLISIVTEENFTVGNTTYKPYSDLESQNNEFLLKFIDAIDKLEDWRNTFANKTSLDVEDIKKIQDFFAYWFSFSSDDKDGFGGEKIVYSSIKNEIQNQKILLSAGFETINADSFFMALKDNAKGAKGNGTNLYVGGITFSKLTPNRTIPAKYVYILGLNSKTFPGTDSELSIDLRKKIAALPGDVCVSDTNKQAFLCQFMATGEKLYISYVNKDLKKDEEFFNASLVDDLLAFIGGGKNLLKEISIDEERKWNELYTQKSFRNKTNFKEVTKPKKSNFGNTNDENMDLPPRVSISKLKDFLNNPFIFYAGRFFSTEDDSESENESEMFEPLDLDRLTNKDVSDSNILGVLKFLQENANNTQSVDDLVQQKVQEEIAELKLQHIISDNVFGQVAETKLKAQIRDAVNSINEEYGIDNSVTDVHFNENIRISLEYEKAQWELTGNLCPYIFDKSTNTVRVFDITYSGIKRKTKLKPYLTAIAKIAEEGREDVAYSVTIDIFGDKKESINLTKTIDVQEAKKILNVLYTNMYVKPYKKMLLINNAKTDYKDWGEFKSSLSRYSDWTYFSQKALFDPYKDFGFTANAFTKNENGMTQYEEEIEKWKGFVPGLF